MVKSQPILSTLGLVFWLVSTLPAIAADGPDPRRVSRVLVVYEDASTLPATIEIAKGIREGLEARSGTRFELDTEYLDIVRFPSPDHLRRLGDDLAAKYADIHFDVLMAVGHTALQFMLENRARIADGAPLIFGSDTEPPKDKPLPADVKGVLTYFDLGKTIDLAGRLQPNAKKAIVLTGSADYDRLWEKIARESLGASPDLQVEYLSGLTMEGFKEKAKQLPADVILLILTVYEDAEGIKLVPHDAAAEIAAASGAPSYSVYSTFIGTGILGGYVVTFESMGQDMVRLTDQYLAGAASTPAFKRE